jgi:hypothetical protein
MLPTRTDSCLFGASFGAKFRDWSSEVGRDRTTERKVVLGPCCHVLFAPSFIGRATGPKGAVAPGAAPYEQLSAAAVSRLRVGLTVLSQAILLSHCCRNCLDNTHQTRRWVRHARDGSQPWQASPVFFQRSLPPARAVHEHDQVHQLA